MLLSSEAQWKSFRPESGYGSSRTTEKTLRCPSAQSGQPWEPGSVDIAVHRHIFASQYSPSRLVEGLLTRPSRVLT